MNTKPGICPTHQAPLLQLGKILLCPLCAEESTAARLDTLRQRAAKRWAHELPGLLLASGIPERLHAQSLQQWARDPATAPHHLFSRYATTLVSAEDFAGIPLTLLINGPNASRQAFAAACAGDYIRNRYSALVVSWLSVTDILREVSGPSRFADPVHRALVDAPNTPPCSSESALLAQLGDVQFLALDDVEPLPGQWATDVRFLRLLLHRRSVARRPTWILSPTDAVTLASGFGEDAIAPFSKSPLSLPLIAE